MTKRRLLLGALAAFLLISLYRVFAVYTVRDGECGPGTGPAERTGAPGRPLVVMTYNIAGHDELVDGDHVRRIAAEIRRLRPDIVALQEVHRGTWQARFRDQLAELESLTGLHGSFAPSYVLWGGGYGNAVLTRGTIVQTRVHPLPCAGEPRAVLEATVRIDQATVNVYATHLTAWGRFNAKIRTRQLRCLAGVVRASRHPFILAGDFNAGPDSPEMAAFRREGAAQLASRDSGPTFRHWDEQIDYIFTDPGWRVRASRAWPAEASDHLPVTAEVVRVR